MAPPGIMPTVLIDTDVLIEVARNSPTWVKKLSSLEELHMLATSVVTRMELIAGCRDKPQLRRIDYFLRRFRIVELTNSAGNLAASLVYRYRLSHGLLIPDALIAATAMTESLPFLTRNLRDYRFIEGLSLLDN
jgi:predicted nucleic acid-binding protein